MSTCAYFIIVLIFIFLLIGSAREEKILISTDWKIVMDQYPIGRKFLYLGVEMIVERYYNYHIICTYRANNELKEWAFSPNMSDVLKDK